jgi:hypothetical protein
VSRFVVIITLALSVSSCGTLQSAQKLWPFGKKGPPAPVAVSEVAFESAPGQAIDIAQYWRRNTLVFDLQSVSGAGVAVARPREGTSWPVRVAIRTRPGSVGEFDVRGSQRVLLPVPLEGSAAVDFELPPEVVRPETKEIAIHWGPRRDPDAPSAVTIPAELPEAAAVEPSAAPTPETTPVPPAPAPAAEPQPPSSPGAR